MSDTDPLLSVRDLRVTVPGDRGQPVAAVRGVSFDLRAGEVLAVVGESGAGKSLTARALLGLLPHGVRVEGAVRYRGQVVADRRGLWGRRMAFVPQDALAVLSPVHRVGDQLAAAVRSVARVPRRAAWARAVAALDRVGIPEAARRARSYPHEFSGGMRQRAVIAMALVNEPELIVADEPTTALDPLVQEQVLGVLTEVREQSGAALVLVTHDIALAAGLGSGSPVSVGPQSSESRTPAARMLVLYAGRVAELGPVTDVLAAPRAPYTAGLIASLPSAEPTPGERLATIGGAPPSPDALAASVPGCAFAPRCPLAGPECTEREPALRGADDGHLAACHREPTVPAADLWRPAA
ncbi:ABC transporter ATP-binding protein [Streptomyces sp. NPDC002851]